MLACDYKHKVERLLMCGIQVDPIVQRVGFGDLGLFPGRGVK